MRAIIYLRVSSAQQVEKDLTEEGYSLPAQRDACLRFVGDHRWELAGEFRDAGESARSADRPELKRMLAAVKNDPSIRFVVVHKINRIARNMEDHMVIRGALSKAGARLVSVTEGIDDSPSGRFMESILAAMAEYESANMGVEIKKGMRQKIKMGGWPRRAPIGYVNRRETIDGRSVASVVIDPERAPLVVEAFERYASGTIGARALAERMADRGLRTRRGAIVSASRWLEIFRSPFYIGRVYDGEDEYEGAHPRLISDELFERVQNVIAIRDYAGPRQYRHFHHLKGTLYCAECGSLLSFSRSKGRSGRYDYFYCLRKSGCSQPYIRVEVADEQADRLVPTVGLGRQAADLVREGVRRVAAELSANEEKERTRLSRKIERLEGQSSKLMQAFYAHKIDDDILGREQHRLSSELRRERRQLDALSSRLGFAVERIDRAVDVLVQANDRYADLSPMNRRRLARALFAGIYVRDRQIERFELVHGLSLIRRTADALAGGSNMNCLVELAGRYYNRLAVLRALLLSPAEARSVENRAGNCTLRRK